MRLAVSLKTILLGIAVLVVSFFVSLKTMDWLSPRGVFGRRRWCICRRCRLSRAPLMVPVSIRFRR